MNSPVILHLPHSSRDIPDELRSSYHLSPDELAAESLRVTDLYTDELFQLADAERIVFPVNRLVVDPERFADIESEPMEARGVGAVYRTASDGRPLRASMNREDLIARYYRPHHERLTALTRSCLEAFGVCLIVDCHSFPSIPLSYDLDQSEPRPEFCIGTDPFHTPPKMTELAMTHFNAEGFKVLENQPYSGTMVPMEFLGTCRNVHSIMIEIRRDLYMDELTGDRTVRFGEMQRLLGQLLQRLETLTITKKALGENQGQ